MHEEQLSSYERWVLELIARRKATPLDDSTMDRMSERMMEAQERGRTVLTRRMHRMPGFDAAAQKARGGYASAVSGMARMATDGARRSLSDRRVLRAYSRHGFPMRSLDEIHLLDLEVVEKEVMPSRLAYAYAALAGAEGAAAGAFMTAGDVAAVAGGMAGRGAGAAPGMATIGGTLAADAASMLAVCTRVVAHTAMYYGYDPEDQEERLFGLAIVNLGTAMTASGRYQAYVELSRLTRRLFVDAQGSELSQFAMTRVLSRFTEAFSTRFARSSYGRMLPVVGIAAGFGMNAWNVYQVAEAARWAYRERFLMDKLETHVMSMPNLQPAGNLAEENIDVLGMMEAEVSAERTGASDPVHMPMDADRSPTSDQTEEATEVIDDATRPEEPRMLARERGGAEPRASMEPYQPLRAPDAPDYS